MAHGPTGQTKRSQRFVGHRGVGHLVAVATLR